MFPFLRFLARRPLTTSAICRKEFDQISTEYVNKIRQKSLRFSETSSFYGRGGSLGSTGQPTGADSDEAFAMPFYVASYYDSYRFQYIRIVSIFSSLALFLGYIAWFREPSDVDELWNLDMRLVYIVAKKRVLQDQIEQTKKGGKSTADLETQLIDLEAQEEKIRKEEEKKLKKEEMKKNAALART